MDSLRNKYDSFPKTSKRWGATAKKHLEELLASNSSYSAQELAVLLYQKNPRHGFTAESIESRLREIRHPLPSNAPVESHVPIVLNLSHSSIDFPEDFSNQRSPSLRIPSKRASPKDWKSIRQQSQMRALNLNHVAGEASTSTQPRRSVAEAVTTAQLTPAAASPTFPSSDLDDFLTRITATPSLGTNVSEGIRVYPLPDDLDGPPRKKKFVGGDSSSVAILPPLSIRYSTKTYGHHSPFLQWAVMREQVLLKFVTLTTVKVQLSWPPPADDLYCLEFIFDGENEDGLSLEAVDVHLRQFFHIWRNMESQHWKLNVFLPSPVSVVVTPNKDVYETSQNIVTVYNVTMVSSWIPSTASTTSRSSLI